MGSIIPRQSWNSLDLSQPSWRRSLTNRTIRRVTGPLIRIVWGRMWQVKKKRLVFVPADEVDAMLSEQVWRIARLSNK